VEGKQSNLFGKKKNNQMLVNTLGELISRTKVMFLAIELKNANSIEV